MENRSHALLAGTFTLVLLLAIAAGAFWLGRDRGDVAIYRLASDSSVNGLSTQSDDRYQGVNVGKVQSIGFDPDTAGIVKIRIGVRPGTPITTSTWAELGVRGVTGISVVELRDEAAKGDPLETSEEDPAEIPIRPGTLQRLENRGLALMDSVERVAKRIESLVDDKNVQSLENTMTSMAGLTASLETSANALQPAAEKVGPLLDSLNRATGQAEKVAQDVSRLTRSAQQTLARLEAPGGPIDMATQSMAELSWAVARLGNDAAPQITGMAEDVGTAARGMSRTLERVDERPQSFLFGPAPVRPGPGEAGFEGFRSR